MSAAKAVKAVAEAPDGGYGWVVVAAYSLNTIVVLQIMGVFGLIFKDLFAEMGLPTTDIALILNLNMSFSMLIGIFTNALMRRLGFRQMGAAGAVLAALGMLLTALSSSSPALVFNFGIVMASGLGLSSPAFTVALNVYFRARRSVATGVAMGITGVSAILLPQLTGLLLREYGARGTCLLFAGLALNGLVAAVLLQPVQWHRPAPRKVLVEPVLETPSVHENEEDPMVDKEFALPALPVLKMEEHDPENGWLGVRPRTSSTTSTYYTARCPSECSTSIWASTNVLDMGSSVITLNDPIPEEPVCASPLHVEKVHKAEPEATAKVENEAASARAGAVRRCCTYLVDMFDLGLLRDPSILNLLLGVCVASFVEMNFSVLVPFILSERGLDTASIANAMSIIALCNTAARLLAPLPQAMLGWSSRHMYTLSLLLVTAGRVALLLAGSETAIMVAAVVVGASRGCRTLFYALVVPDSVPQERLAAAIGLQAVISGLIFLASGPLIGYLRDATGSYDMVIIVFNVITMLCCAMWVLEDLVLFLRGSRKKRKEPSWKQLAQR